MPDIDISQDRVAKALAAGGPGKFANSPRFRTFPGGPASPPGPLSFMGDASGPWQPQG